MATTLYGLVCADDLASGDARDRRSANVAGTYGRCLGQLRYYPPEIASRLRLCVWCPRRGCWVPNGSDE